MLEQHKHNPPRSPHQPMHEASHLEHKENAHRAQREQRAMVASHGNVYKCAGSKCQDGHMKFDHFGRKTKQKQNKACHLL